MLDSRMQPQNNYTAARETAHCTFPGMCYFLNAVLFSNATAMRSSDYAANRNDLMEAMRFHHGVESTTQLSLGPTQASSSRSP